MIVRCLEQVLGRKLGRNVSITQGERWGVRYVVSYTHMYGRKLSYVYGRETGLEICRKLGREMSNASAVGPYRNGV